MAGWLFLGVTLIGAALVWNVYRPSFANARLGFVSFFLGWLEAELALHHVLWQGVATVGFVAAGALESPAGKLGLVVTGVSWLALGLHWSRGFKVRGAVEHALTEGLGADYEKRLLPEPRRSLDRSVNWMAVAAPFPLRLHYPDVERVPNIGYARAGGIDLKLDVSVPRYEDVVELEE